MSVIIKQWKARAFLVWCVKVANADRKDYEYLIKDKVLVGLLQWSSSTELEEIITTEIAARVYAQEMKNLTCNVRKMAELLTKGNEFVYEILTTKSWNAKKTILGERLKIGYVKFEKSRIFGRVRYLEGNFSEAYKSGDYPELIPDSYPDKDKLIAECKSGELTELFIEAFNVYRKSKEINHYQVPLKICDWCGSPFFGNRYDQRFCNRNHSVKWHGKKAYEKKKKRKNLFGSLSSLSSRLAP